MTDCENVNVQLWNKATQNQNANYPNLFVSIHMGSPSLLDYIPRPDGSNPELLGESWESYDEYGDLKLEDENLAFQLTDPNMIVVTFTNPGDTWSVCQDRDKRDALFLSLPNWINKRTNDDGSPNLLTGQARVYFPGDYLFNSLVVWEDATEEYFEEFDIFPLTYTKGIVNKEPWKGFNRKEAHLYEGSRSMYKSMTFKYLLDQISLYHKGSYLGGQLLQPPYIVYISACNPYPESDLGWNDAQIREIAHFQDYYNALGFANKLCLKEKLLETSTRFSPLKENADLDGDPLATAADIFRWREHESVYTSQIAKDKAWRAQNFGITLQGNEVCETECEPYFKCLPESMQCLDYCKVKGQSKKCKKISDEEYDELYGLYGHEKWEGGNKKKRRSKTRRRKRKLRKNKHNMTRQRKKSVIKKKRTRRFRN